MDPDKILQVCVGWSQISRVKMLASWAKGAQNGGEKGGSFFCNGYNEFAFLCNGTNQHEIRGKTSMAVLYWTLIEQFWKSTLKGVILPQTAIFGCFNSSPCHKPTGQGVRFLTYLSLPSIRGRANGVPILNRLFVRLNRFGCRRP